MWHKVRKPRSLEKQKSGRASLASERTVRKPRLNTIALRDVLALDSNGARLLAVFFGWERNNVSTRTKMITYDIGKKVVG